MTDPQAMTGAALYRAGFHDLVSVIPPSAALAPSSRISPEQRGKVPGRRLGNGTWVGYDWRKELVTESVARQWDVDGANIGLRADAFPGVDVDCTDPALAALIIGYARSVLGPAPLRTGRAPKALLMYRTDVPFGRLRLWVKDRITQTTHLVEVLGAGQQYVVSGIHPATRTAYTWDADVLGKTSTGLTGITLADAKGFLLSLTAALELAGYEVWQEGSGGAADRESVAQEDLLAPSLELLAEVVRAIPNDDPQEIGRDAYIKLGYAVRAAAGANAEDAFGIFLEWALRWPGNDRAPGTSYDAVWDDWRRMKPPYAVGWTYLLGLARHAGYNDAALDFEAQADTKGERGAVFFSDHDLLDRVLERYAARIRSVPAWGGFLVWDGYRWKRDTTLQTEAMIAEVLREAAERLAWTGGTKTEQRDALMMARSVLNANSVRRVRNLLAAHGSLTLNPDQLDADPWLLNTPNGVIDLRTGLLLPPDVDRLMSKSVAATPDSHHPCPRWMAFLAEACPDAETVLYLQRFAGYCMTGSTREHSLTFVHGPGGTGKSVFLDTLAYVLGDYATTAPMEVFTASKFDRHPTELAALMGARLVTANETDAGRRWNEARVKNLTGGDKIAARVMRSDFFYFYPQFKLLIAGNHRPIIQHVDEAMQRRLHLVPFDKQPAVRDEDLREALRAEAPGILAWMLAGCLDWQRKGLPASQAVEQATLGYFESEDVMAQWLEDECERDPLAFVPSNDLYRSWAVWCEANGASSGGVRSFVADMERRGYKRTRGAMPDGGRVRGFHGLRLARQTELSRVFEPEGAPS